MVGQSDGSLFRGRKNFRSAAAPAAILKAARREVGRPVRAWVAQLVERVLGKDEVTGSIPVPGSRLQSTERSATVGESESRLRTAPAKGLQGMSGGNSVVESLPSKQMVAGSSPVPRSMARPIAKDLRFFAIASTAVT